MARDRRCAIEMCVVRQELEEANGTVRWVNHPSMAADPLTKKGGNCACLQQLMATGRYSLKEEHACLLARASAEELKVRVKKNLDAKQIANARGTSETSAAADT